MRLAVSLQPTGPVLLALSYSELWAPAVKASGFTPEQHAPPRILTCGSSISTGLFYGGAEIWLVATTQIIFGPDNADLRDLNCMQKAMARSGGIHLAKLMVAKAPTGQSRLRELEPSHPPLDASAPT